MGGRGARSENKRLPNYRNAEIPKNKIGNYLLNPSNKNNQDKDKLFNSIGYNMQNKAKLKEDILKQLKTSKAKLQKSNGENKYYEVEMKLGVNKKIDFITIWLVDKKTTRFITAKPKERKK